MLQVLELKSDVASLGLGLLQFLQLKSDVTLSNPNDKEQRKEGCKNRFILQGNLVAFL